MKTTLFVVGDRSQSEHLRARYVKTETIKVSGWKCEKCPAKTEPS